MPKRMLLSAPPYSEAGGAEPELGAKTSLQVAHGYRDKIMPTGMILTNL
jgi:hypothetical protein